MRGGYRRPAQEAQREDGRTVRETAKVLSEGKDKGRRLTTTGNPWMGPDRRDRSVGGPTREGKQW